MAFELFVELGSKAAVAKRLNESGHRTRRGAEWRDVTVARLLSCPSARGLYPVAKSALNEDGERVEKPADEWEYVECPRIVSEALWEQVQSALTNDVKASTTVQLRSHSFTGLLFCACGGRMNASGSSPKYVCAKCGRRIAMADLDAVFLDEVTSFLHARKRIAAERISGDPELASERSLLRQREERVQQIDGEIAKTERLYMENRITVQRFEKLHHPLEAERVSMQREIGRIRAKIKRLESKAPTNEKPASFNPKSLRDRWPTLVPAARHEIARTFVERIVVSDDEIEFAYRFRDPFERTAKPQQIPGPTNSRERSESTGDEPLYIRLPKPGQLCPRTGMTRSALNELILPTGRNSYRPLVESKCLRKHKDGKGTRLIVWQSLKEYLAKR
jgi:site-specific DNA recombinase